MYCDSGILIMNALDEFSTLTINNVCRICLLKKENMRSVFSKLDQTEVLETNVAHISDVLKKITSVPISETDGFPQLVCLNCLALILAAYKFKIQFDNSYSVLQQYLANCVKVEETLVCETIESDNDDTQFECSSSNGVHLSTQNCKETGISTDKVQIKCIKQQSSSRLPIKLGNQKQEKEKCEDGVATKTVKSKDMIKTFPCSICTREFPALELKQHAHSHKAFEKYLNIPADKRVKPGTQFYVDNFNGNTVVSIHNRKEKLHKCVMCNVELNAIELRLHLDSHRNEEAFKCDQCGRVFKKMNHLNTHRVKHLKEFPFKCEQCGKGFVIKTNYECHMLTHKANEELPYECSQCFRRFYNPEHLNRHMLLHTENVSYSVKYRVWKCYHCLKTFEDREKLKAHECVPIEKTHTVQYTCKDCNKVFKTYGTLYNHTRNIHSLNGAKVLCSVCGIRVSSIYDHMMRHTGERRYQCTQCDKRFIGKPQLRQHLLVHSGLKPFVCKVCSKAFNNSCNLQVHERIHKGDKCHICSICNKAFLEKSYLKKHMNVHRKA